MSGLTPPLSVGGRILGAFPTLKLPKLGREVEVPVYVIHNSEGREDYFFLFDFEVFVDRSKSGAFVRPKLKVWAGRDDFDRAIFARQFRQVFTDEFDRMRDTIAQGGPKMGWLTMNFGFDGVTRFVSGLVANVVLLIAKGAGRVLFGGVEDSEWPLPIYVKKHLGDRESGSWW